MLPCSGGVRVARDAGVGIGGDGKPDPRAFAYDDERYDGRGGLSPVCVAAAVKVCNGT